MKKGITALLFLVSLFAFSQDIIRENIKGKIIVEGNDIDGITIYNTVTKKGAVSDVNGEFTIAAATNDFLEIRAIEYQNFDIKVNDFIIESKKMNIYLIEEINMLDEVVVTNRILTGDISSDLKSIKTFKPKLNTIYFSRKSTETNNFNDSKPVNTDTIVAHSQAQTMVNGLNIVNVVDQLLIPLFRSEVNDKKAAGIPEVPAKSIKYYLASNFLVENFSIPVHRVEEFIRYVEDETFDFEMLNYGHELEFLELLSKKSKTFLDAKKSDN